MSAADSAPRSQAMWNPFANMAAIAGHEVQIVRGAGATVYDSAGRAYLDALAENDDLINQVLEATLDDAEAAEIRIVRYALPRD